MKRASLLIAGLVLAGCSDQPTSEVTEPSAARSVATSVSYHKSGGGMRDRTDFLAGHALFHPKDRGVVTAIYDVEARRRSDGNVAGVFTLWLPSEGDQRILGQVVCFSITDNRARVGVKVLRSVANRGHFSRKGGLAVSPGDYLAFTVIVDDAADERSGSDAWNRSHGEHHGRAHDETSYFTQGDQSFATAHCAGGQDGTLYRVIEGRFVMHAGESTPPPTPDPVTGLDFAGNVNFPAASPSVLFVFNAALSGTAPFPAYPATYIWRAYPRSNVNYWSGLFHANYSTQFDWQINYYGMHPYPHLDDPMSPAHWEISMGGGDLESPNPVVTNQWYTQVVTTTSTYRQTFYWNWPNNTTDVLTAQDNARIPPPNPAIIVGDAPWNAGFENYSGVLRGFQFYDVVLTEEEIQREIESPGSVRQPWYLNLNPTPADISDKSGNNHHPAWVGSNRPALWTQ